MVARPTSLSKGGSISMNDSINIYFDLVVALVDQSLRCVSVCPENNSWRVIFISARCNYATTSVSVCVCPSVCDGSALAHYS